MCIRDRDTIKHKAMQLGIFVWIILIIILLGGFKTLAIMAGVIIIAFISGLFIAATQKMKGVSNDYT